MAKLKVYVKNNQTEVKVPVGIRLLIRRCCQAVLTTEGYKENAEVSVSFVSNSEIRKLNKFYRNKDSVTDVLSKKGSLLKTSLCPFSYIYLKIQRFRPPHTLFCGRLQPYPQVP